MPIFQFLLIMTLVMIVIAAILGASYAVFQIVKKLISAKTQLTICLGTILALASTIFTSFLVTGLIIAIIDTIRTVVQP